MNQKGHQYHLTLEEWIFFLILKDLWTWKSAYGSYADSANEIAQSLF